MYRPPSDDSDTESDEFNFGSENTTKLLKEKFLPSIHQDQINDLLYDSVKTGDIDKMIELWEAHYPFNSIDMPLTQGWSLLLYASYYGHFYIVKYLIEKQADVNKQIDSVTPLIVSCDCNNPSSAFPITELLLKRGAFINVADRNGTTPLMNAIKNGFVEIVKLIVNRASLEATNWYGNTALAYAVERNSEELVLLLLSNGAVINTSNKSGSTPREIAVRLGYENIVELFPKVEEEYIVPPNYRYYTHYEDLAPSVFRSTSQSPDYFPEIEPILVGMKMEKFIKNFAQNNINLEEFLTISDKRLEEIGIIFPYQRNCIHLGLLKFHGYPWSKKSINKVTAFKAEDTFDFYIIVAGLLKHLVVLKSSLKYILTSEYVRTKGQINLEVIDALLMSIRSLKTFINSMKENILNLRSFNSPIPVLQVDLRNAKYSSFYKSVTYLTYTSILGLFFWACFKLKQNYFTQVRDLIQMKKLL